MNIQASSINVHHEAPAHFVRRLRSLSIQSAVHHSPPPTLTPCTSASPDAELQQPLNLSTIHSILIQFAPQSSPQCSESQSISLPFHKKECKMLPIEDKKNYCLPNLPYVMIRYQSCLGKYVFVTLALQYKSEYLGFTANAFSSYLPLSSPLHALRLALQSRLG